VDQPARIPCTNQGHGRHSDDIRGGRAFLARLGVRRPHLGWWKEWFMGVSSVVSTMSGRRRLFYLMLAQFP
jgi:hypothetical protein